MLNPNIEMLENLISAAVSTRYKEVPPTEEEFLTLAQSMRATLSTLPVTDEEFAEILVRLRASIVIQMDVGVYINDRNTPHKSWLPSRRADLDFFFWNRYKKYLEEIKHWNPRVTATLDKVSDEIVDLLGDPQSKEPFQRRGLVLGDVQSGKTANYTAISNKAADTGYRIIIVLAGMMENLRQQTQSRLDAEFSGRKSEYYLDPKAEQGIKNQPVGVGRYGVQKRIAAFTSVTKDFDINVLKSNDLNLQSVSDPIVLVVKKNKRILNNLIKWLSNSRDNTTGKIMLPMLLIDDEADNASVNTKSEDDSPAAINACIRQLLHEFNQASYLGITATPFANIFINPETEDEMIGDDLFPRDFIYSLAPPTNYIGADKIFGDATEKFSNVNQREAVFRTQLYTVFDDPRFSCVQHPVIIKEKNKTLTDIDAVVIDKKTGEIALFQLKWQDPADYSPFTLKSKRSNYYSAAEKWLEIIEKWLSNSADEDIASKLGVKVKYFDKKKISIFVLGRRRGNYSGNGPYPYECAWSQWYQIMYAASYLRQENEFTISNLYKLIVSTSPFNIKISEKPVTFCYGKYRIKFGGKTFCGKDTR